jgi:hypothetical protein
LKVTIVIRVQWSNDVTGVVVVDDIGHIAAAQDFEYILHRRNGFQQFAHLLIGQIAGGRRHVYFYSSYYATRQITDITPELAGGNALRCEWTSFC